MFLIIFDMKEKFKQVSFRRVRSKHHTPMRCSVILYVLLHVVANLIAAPPDNVTGRIFDNDTREALPGATIIDSRGRVTSSDINGHFSLFVPDRQQTITFQYVGYQTVHETIVVYPDSLLMLHIGMTAKATEIEQVVVSASRIEQKVAESTVSVSIIQPDQLASGHLTDPEEILNKSSGIQVLDGQASIRGGSGYSYGAGSRVLVLIDGLPALTPDAGSVRWRSLPLENISQVEIIKGASSVLYGSSALNGIINFRTAEATKEGKTSFYTESGVFGNPRQRNWIWWDKPRTYHNASLAHSQRTGQTDITLGSFFLLDNGYRKLDDKKLARTNFRIKRRHRQVDGLSYGLAMNGGIIDKHDFILWEDAEYGALKQNEMSASQMRGLYVFADPFVSFRQEDRQTHDLRLRFQASDNTFREDDKNNSRTRSVYAEYQTWFRAAKSLSINAGVSRYDSNIRSNLYGNHEAMNMAVYAQANIHPNEKTTLVTGLRLEHNALNNVSDKPVLLFRAGANYRLRSATFLRASFGQGYRYPSIAEKHAATTIGPVNIIPNPNIQAESGWNAELGVKQGLLTPRLDGLIDLALFYGQNTDMIEYMFGFHYNLLTNRFEMGFMATNIEHSRVYGTELEFLINHSRGLFKNTISGGYVFMLPVEFNPETNRNTGDYLKFRRKHSANLSFTTTYNRLKGGLYFYLKSRILEIDDVFLNPLTREQIMPGFYGYWQENNKGHFAADLSIGFRLSQKHQLSLVIKNFTNTEYMGRPGDIRPHRNFSLRFSGQL